MKYEEKKFENPLSNKIFYVPLQQNLRPKAYFDNMSKSYCQIVIKQFGTTFAMIKVKQ